MPWTNRPIGTTLLALFFIFGAGMASLTALMLLFPGSILEPLWRLNPRAHEGFGAMGAWAVLLMLTVATACAVAAAGLWRCTRWGTTLAIVILSVNLLGDTMNALIGRNWRTLIGLPVGGAMILYLMSQRRARRH